MTQENEITVGREKIQTNQRWPTANLFISAAWQRTMKCVRALMLVALLVLAVLVVHGSAPDWLLGRGAADPGALLAASLLYALLLAIPFIPSVEIGLLIMMVFGKAGAISAYLATVIGLNLAYAIGRALSHRIDGTADRPGHSCLPGGIASRVRQFMDRLPQGSPIIALMLLLNLPANTLLGGGGGIALVYGATRMLPWPVFAVTVCCATSVIPMLFLLGLVSAENML